MSPQFKTNLATHALKPWQNDWTFALNMHWTNVQCKMLRRFATLSNLVQLCSVMLRVVQSILKAVKDAQWTRLNFFYLKMLRQDVQSFCHPPVCARAFQTKQTQKLHAFYHGGNVHWTMFSRFATSKNFCYVHTLNKVRNVQ